MAGWRWQQPEQIEQPSAKPSRPGRIVRTETRRRGFFGWVFLLLFIGFNAVMLAWLVSYWQLVGQMPEADSAAGRAGAQIGAMLGTGSILFVWLCGAVITGLLALLTRGRKTIVEEYLD